MQQYKLRAELLADIGKLVVEMAGSIKRAEICHVKGDGEFPDSEFIFSCDLSLEEVQDSIRAVEDSHVMLQTVQPIERYTGERDYNIK